jgi:hypothetical protein
VIIEEALIGFLCSDILTVPVEEGQPVLPLKPSKWNKASRRM